MLKTKKTSKTKKRPKVKPKDCVLIQWGKAHLDKHGEPICPDCGEPAELVLGFGGNPCYAHKIK